jgi:hypothetical protein
MENVSVPKESTTFVFRVDSTLKMETAGPSERLVSTCMTSQYDHKERGSVSIYKSTWNHNPGDHIPNYTLITIASKFGALTEVAQSKFKRLKMYAKTDKRN